MRQRGARGHTWRDDTTYKKRRRWRVGLQPCCQRGTLLARPIMVGSGDPLKRTAGAETARPSPSAVTDTCRESPQGDSVPADLQLGGGVTAGRGKDAKPPAARSPRKKSALGDSVTSISAPAVERPPAGHHEGGRNRWGWARSQRRREDRAAQPIVRRQTAPCPNPPPILGGRLPRRTCDCPGRPLMRCQYG